MPIVQRLRNLFGRNPVYLSILPEELPQVGNMTARELYATQANLHAVVSFLSDSIAQLPLKVYRRDGETDRQRDRDSIAAKLLWRPNADQTAYEFINALGIEFMLMGCATVWVLPDPDSDSGYQLRIIPREWIMQSERVTNYAPDKLKITAGTGEAIEITRKEFVQFRMYSPGNPGGYQSPIAALRQTLNEQIQADKFRTKIYRSSGRFNAYITRPKDVAPWDDETKKKWLAMFREGWSAEGENAGKMPLLEDGMEIKPYQFNAKEAQYAETKQLSREDVAAAYHVNPSLIWHTTTQTYASAKDNARALYADCLGPTLQMMQQRINSFLLPMIGADPALYVEFDLTEKLKGSFEERASILQSAVGGPYMTRNEARADSNLPPVDGGDELIVPLNVLTGGQASPTDTHMDPKEPMATEPLKMRGYKSDKIRVKARSTKEEDERMAEALRKFWKRQASSVIQTRKYLHELAKARAEAINKATYRKLKESIGEDDEDEDPAHVFDVRQNKDSITFGRSLALVAAGWAAVHEAPHQAEQQGIRKTVEKMWVTGDNPRQEHALMNGQIVPIDEPFSNGCFWPGDENGDPDTTCGCNCSTEVIITIG